MTTLTYGLDPEFFVLGYEGQYIPTWDLCHGEDYQLRYGKLVPDGAAMEFTVTPAHSPQELVAYVRENIKDISNIIPHTISLSPDLEIAPDIIDTYGNEYNRCSLQIFGCNPTINVYDLNSTINSASIYYNRCLGGHIHFGGLQDVDMYTISGITGALDQVIAVAANKRIQATGDEKLYHKYLHRRDMYGKLGEIRWHPEDGRLEYRALSAIDILSSPETCEATVDLAGNIVEWVLDILSSNNGWDTYWKYFKSHSRLRFSAISGGLTNIRFKPPTEDMKTKLKRFEKAPISEIPVNW